MMNGIAVRDQKRSTGGCRSGEAQALLPPEAMTAAHAVKLRGRLRPWWRGGLIVGRLSCLATIDPCQGTMASIDCSGPARLR